MTLAHQLPKQASVEDLIAIPEPERFHELIGGRIVRKALPSGEHGDAQSAISAILKGPFQIRPGGKGPGGWWIYTEVEVELAVDHVYRPDLVGWRRESAPQRPTGTPIALRPDWICEIVSPSTAKLDRVGKLNEYHKFGIPHYWLVDPAAETLTVVRWTEEGYLVVLSAQAGETVRAEPFDGIDIIISHLFGGDADTDVEL